LRSQCLAANSGTGSVNTSGWKTLSIKDITIKYPKEWAIDQSGAMNTTFFLTAPKAKPNDEFENTINLIIQNDDPKMTLEKYNDMYIAQLYKELPKANVISSKTINAKVPYREIHYSGVQIKYRLEWYQFLFIKNKNIYSLTFTCEQTAYARLFPVASAIMHSFAIIK
jgi:hypothetical protein